MSEWWTYAPSDFLLYSPRTWYRQLELYNLALWPAQLVAIVLGLFVAASIVRGRASSGRAVALVLGAAWLFVAWAFHYERYAQINWTATYFATAFAIEGVALVVFAWVGDGLKVARPQGPHGVIAVALVTLAVVAYPIIAPLMNRGATAAETFGVMPDPTALATVAVLAASAAGRRFALLVVPLLWCGVSAMLLRAMGAPEWPIPAVGALLGAIAAASRR